jgi:hypothetical protein
MYEAGYENLMREGFHHSLGHLQAATSELLLEST